MSPNAPAGLTCRESPLPAEARGTRPFDDWVPEPADPNMDVVDRIIGRAALDPAFRALLLADSVAALATEQMPLGLKRALVEIRARSLPEFAVRALEAQRGAVWRPSPILDMALPQDLPLLPAIGSLAGVGF